MEVWIGGEIREDLDDDFMAATDAVEDAVNDVLAGHDYAIPLEDWDCVAIIREDCEIKESTKYYRSQQRTDYRLRVSYEAFSGASEAKQRGMIFQMLLRSLNLLQTQLPDCEDVETLKDDLICAGHELGWKPAMTAATG
jgi:stress-induced morphogen